MLRRVVTGQESAANLVVGGLVLDIGARTALLDGRTLELSPKEFDLLAHLAGRAGQVVTKKELLTEVWRLPYGGSDKTVDVHLSWLRRKLGETADAAALPALGARRRRQAVRAGDHPRHHHEETAHPARGRHDVRGDSRLPAPHGGAAVPARRVECAQRRAGPQPVAGAARRRRRAGRGGRVRSHRRQPGRRGLPRRRLPARRPGGRERSGCGRRPGDRRGGGGTGREHRGLHRRRRPAGSGSCNR